MKSLEDKAKEYAVDLWGEGHENWEEKKQSEAEYVAIYRQALKDMMAQAEELQLPYIRMYKKIAEELGELKEGKK